MRLYKRYFRNIAIVIKLDNIASIFRLIRGVNETLHSFFNK